MKKNLIKIALDTIPVILGVLIALLISEFRETSKDKRYLKQVFNSVELDFKENREDLISVIGKQNKLQDTLSLYLENDSVSITDVLTKARGIQIMVLKKTSWKGLIESKIELVDYHIYAQLASIDETDEFMKIKVDKTMDFLYKNLDSYESNIKKMFVIHLETLLESEEKLLDMHNTYLGIEEQE